MKALILSAGRATRLRGLVPGGAKALLRVAGRTVLDRQLDHLAGWNAELVVREPVASCPVPQMVVPTEHFGPAGALWWALDDTPGPVLVVYGDTLWTSPLPDPGDWIGVAEPPSMDRCWDVVSQRSGRIEYRHVASAEQVCVGLYCFAHGRRLRAALDVLADIAPAEREVGMAELLPIYHSGAAPDRWSVQGWTDVGDRDALAAAEHRGIA